jgi:hypothetical protein
MTDFRYFPETTTNSSVNLPDGPFNPTNYSGTQVNFWGVANAAPADMLGKQGWSGPYGGYTGHLGAMTSNMLNVSTEDRS